MKVLKEGRPQEGWAIEIECTGAGNKEGGCGALLLVERDDVFVTRSHARDETTTYNTFRCGACGVWTDIYERRLPFKPREKDPRRDGTESGGPLLTGEGS